MARVKITNATIVAGKHVPAGAVVDIDVAEARALFIAGKAVPTADDLPKPMTRDMDEPTDEE